MVRARQSAAGVTLIEMLVVLAIFAVLLGAVVLSSPVRQTSTSMQVSALALASDIDRAIGLALTQGRGFGLAVEDDKIRILQAYENGTWQAHTDPHLAKLKLFPAGIRILDQPRNTGLVFALSPTLVPEQDQPLWLAFGDGPYSTTLIYDGVNVRVEEGER